MLGIIAGTGLYDPGFLGESTKKTIGTRYGNAYALVGDGFTFIMRHGRKRDVPPHMINHKANMAAFGEEGIEEVLAVTSVGSLKKEIVPGSIVVPHDYVQLTGIPTLFDESAVHVTPGLDAGLRRRLIAVSEELGIKAIQRGVYFQATGPRLETRAEIALFRDYADVIGMSMGSEATIAKELGLRYAALSCVDNYANGIIEEELDFSVVAKRAIEERTDAKKIIWKMVEGSR